MPALTLDQLITIFGDATVAMSGFNESFVRRTFEPNSQPAHEMSQSVIYFNVSPVDNPYDKQRDITYTEGNPTYAEETIRYTRVMQVDWSIYAPNAYDIADIIRVAILTDRIRDMLAPHAIYPITDIRAPQRVPYPFNAQWWERVDLSVLFNVYTTRSGQVPLLESAEVTVTESGGLSQTIIIEGA